MAEQSNNESSGFTENSFFQMIEADKNFEIVPCANVVDIEDKTSFTKLELTTAQKTHVSALLQ